MLVEVVVAGRRCPQQHVGAADVISSCVVACTQTFGRNRLVAGCGAEESCGDVRGHVVDW